MAKDNRRDEVMDAAMELLVERGYRDTTMLAVAKKASASKETLYAWFGDKTGLFKAIIERNAETVQRSLLLSIDSETPPDAALTDFGTALVLVLAGDGAIAINRAAISEVRKDPTLANVLSEAGREKTLPILVSYLKRQASTGRLKLDDPAQAAADFLGLLMSDLQIRRLLGRARPPTRKQAAEKAACSVTKFLRLYAN